MCGDQDRPNEMMFEQVMIVMMIMMMIMMIMMITMMTPQLVSELERINDREVALSPRDHSAIPDMIRPRQTQAFRCYLVYNRLYSVMYYLLRFPVPQPGPRLASSTSHHPLPPQSRGPGLSFSRRNPSGASVASSRSQTKSLSVC